MMGQSSSRDQEMGLGFQRNIALIGVCLFLAKLWAWYLTRSDAIFSDAMESIVNIVAAFMGLYSLYIASKPRDLDHPYGHGKIEFVTSAIEGGLIIFAGGIILIESLRSLWQGSGIGEVDQGIWIILLTALINYFLGYLSLQKGKKQASMVLISSGRHLQSDTWTTLGVALSLGLVNLTGWVWLDAVVALVFGGYILWVGYGIIRQALRGIMDEADPGLLEEVTQILEQNRRPYWIDVHQMKIQQYGSHLHLDAHLTLPWYDNLQTSHQRMEEMILILAKGLNRPVEFNLHMDDCQPRSCRICSLDCPHRQHPQTRHLPWTKQRLIYTTKHHEELSQ